MIYVYNMINYLRYINFYNNDLTLNHINFNFTRKNITSLDVQSKENSTNIIAKNQIT